MISKPSDGPPGAYMVKFQKFQRELYFIVDDILPVVDSST